MTAIATLRRDEIVERISKGEYVKDIAIALGVSKQAISQVLKDDPEYLAAREEGMAARLDNAHCLLADVTEREEISLDDAKALLDLARIREVGLKRLEWRAEREFPHKYGAQKISVNVINGLTINDALQGEALTLLDNVTKKERS